MYERADIFLLSLDNMLLFVLLVTGTVEIQNIIENGICLQNQHIDSFYKHRLTYASVICLIIMLVCISCCHVFVD